MSHWCFLLKLAACKLRLTYFSMLFELKACSRNRLFWTIAHEKCSSPSWKILFQMSSFSSCFSFFLCKSLDFSPSPCSYLLFCHLIIFCASKFFVRGAGDHVKWKDKTKYKLIFFVQEEPGIIPRLCVELFQRISDLSTSDNEASRISCSFQICLKSYKNAYLKEKLEGQGPLHSTGTLHSFKRWKKHIIPTLLCY